MAKVRRPERAEGTTRVTQADVAERAGVSISVVSRELNGCWESGGSSHFADGWDIRGCVISSAISSFRSRFCGTGISIHPNSTTASDQRNLTRLFSQGRCHGRQSFGDRRQVDHRIDAHYW